MLLRARSALEFSHGQDPYRTPLAVPSRCASGRSLGRPRGQARTEAAIAGALGKGEHGIRETASHGVRRWRGAADQGGFVAVDRSPRAPSFQPHRVATRAPGVREQSLAIAKSGRAVLDSYSHRPIAELWGRKPRMR